jgi:hypothetical protein
MVDLGHFYSLFCRLLAAVILIDCRELRDHSKEKVHTEGKKWTEFERNKSTAESTIISTVFCISWDCARMRRNWPLLTCQLENHLSWWNGLKDIQLWARRTTHDQRVDWVTVDVKFAIAITHISSLHCVNTYPRLYLYAFENSGWIADSQVYSLEIIDSYNNNTIWKQPLEQNLVTRLVVTLNQAKLITYFVVCLLEVLVSIQS